MWLCRQNCYQKPQLSSATYHKVHIKTQVNYLFFPRHIEQTRWTVSVTRLLVCTPFREPKPRQVPKNILGALRNKNPGTLTIFI